MKIQKLAIIITSIFLSASAIANSAQEAEKVKQMLTLVADGNPSNCPLSSAFDPPVSQYRFKLNDDATLSEFTIPENYAFVITTMSDTAIYIETSTNYSLLIYSLSGPVNDVVIKPGVKICGTGNNIHGHLEKIR